MQKSNLGISIGFLAAVVYLSALAGGYIPAILLTGYILIKEENLWLRRAAVKAVALLVCFGILSGLIGLVPGALSWIQNLVEIFKGEFNFGIISRIVNLIQDTISLIRTVLFLLLGLKAFKQGTIVVPVIDDVVTKHIL